MPKPNGDFDTERRALLLAPEAPYPMAGGGALRTASLIECLARRYRLDVIVFREPGADPAAQFPPGLAESVFVVDLPAHARHLPARVIRNSSRLVRGMLPLMDRFSGFGERIAALVHGKQYDVAVIEHFWCAPYYEQLTAVRRTVLDLHNIESVLHQRCAAAEPWPQSLAHRLFRETCERLERHWFARFSDLLVASETDAATVRGLCPQARVAVYPNCIPLVPRPHADEQDAIVFSGNMEYHPNISAVRFFRRKIWPRLRDHWPRLVWRLVGKNAHAVRKYTQGDARIQVTGAVDDAIRELATAKVAVVPLLAGSGTRVKILEAFAAARAVVSTSLGAEGLPVSPGENILLADTPELFVGSVSTLLESPSLRLRIGGAARQLFEKEFTWPSAWERLDL